MAYLIPADRRALIAEAVGATLAGVIGSSAEATKRLVRRQTLVRVLAAGGAVVLLAACSSGGSTHGRRAKSSTTAATTTTVAPTTAPPVTYQVKRGDTLTAIAKFFGLSNAALAAANHLANGDQITEGQVLQIPPTPPAQVAVTPPDAPAGTAFMFNMTGAKAGEMVTFEVDAPGGGKFAGSPHTASPDGTVAATYQSFGDDPGTYTVVATGDRGTSVRANFKVQPG